jgi:hypothetical protein
MSQNSTFFVKKQQEAFPNRQDSLHLANPIFNEKIDDLERNIAGARRWR